VAPSEQAGGEGRHGVEPVEVADRVVDGHDVVPHAVLIRGSSDEIRSV